MACFLDKNLRYKQAKITHKDPLVAFIFLCEIIDTFLKFIFLLVWFLTNILFYLIFNFHWSIVDLQSCVTFRCTAK